MAKTPQRAKAKRPRQAAAKGAKKEPGKGVKAVPRRRRGTQAKQRPPLTLSDVWHRVSSWLDHAGGRFAIGIAIGLLLGVVVVIGINRFSHWVTQAPESPMQATGELATPTINDAASQPAKPQPAVSAQPTPAAPPGEAPSRGGAPGQTGKTMEQLITDTQSEITEPESMSPNAPAIAPVQPVRSSPATPPATTPAVTTSPAQATQLASKPVAPSPAPRDADQPAWLRNAVALHAPVTGPMIAIVLDDVGVNKADAELALNLPAPITLSMMTYADNVGDLATRAHARGHELMLHVPMQPVNPKIDPGPNALLVGLDQAELKRRLDWGLSRFPGFIGINNHMGSRFTQDEIGMRVVMQELQSRGLLFLDSRTIANSVGERMARELDVPHVGRDVFLDDDMSAEAVTRQLALTERIAQKQGFVIAIGHPHPTTVAVLQKWLLEAKQRGFVLVPLSAVARREIGVPG